PLGISAALVWSRMTIKEDGIFGVLRLRFGGRTVARAARSSQAGGIWLILQAECPVWRQLTGCLRPDASPRVGLREGPLARTGLFSQKLLSAGRVKKWRLICRCPSWSWTITRP